MKNIFTILFALIIINANSQNPLAIDSIAYVLPSDSNTCDGQIGVYVSGGCTPYVYDWGSPIFFPNWCCGVYPFKVYDNCGDSIADTAYLACPTVIINNFNINQKITVTPNPFSNQFTITIPSNQTAEITIYNPLGQEIKNVIPNTVRNLTVDLSKQPNGIYFLTLTTINQQLQTFKIIKM